jgi:hypothetical protein
MGFLLPINVVKNIDKFMASLYQFSSTVNKVFANIIKNLACAQTEMPYRNFRL